LCAFAWIGFRNSRPDGNGAVSKPRVNQIRNKEQLVKKSRKKITCDDFRVLQYAVKRTRIPGEWMNLGNHRQFRAETGAMLNYWKTKGTITFQGRARAAAELKATLLRRAIVLG
jgi:hypothetical protein